MANINTAKFTNTSSATCIFEYSPEESEDKLGRLIVLFTLDKNQDNYRELFEKIKKNYYSTRENQSVLTQIKRSFHTVRDEIKGEVIIASIIKNNIYVLCFNGAGVVIKRANSLVPLLKTNKNEYSSVSGVLQVGDFIMMATHTPFSILTLDFIKKSLSLKDANESIENLTTMLVDQEQVCIFVINLAADENELEVAAIEPNVNDKQSLRLRLKQSVLPQVKEKGKLVRFIDSLLDKLPKQKIIIKEQGIDQSLTSQKKTASLVGVVLLLILGVSIYFGIKADNKKQDREAYEPTLFDAIRNLEEARELASLSPVRAQDLLMEARSQAKVLVEQEITDERLDELLSDIKSDLADIAGIYEEDAALFLDLSIITSNFQGDKLAFSSGLIRAIDTENKRLVGVESASKRTEIISGPDYFSDVLNTFSYEDRSFVLSTDGIREVTDDVELVVKPQEWESEDILVKSFAGNIYILDRKSNNIWRYQGVRGGYLEPERWLADDINIDFSQAIKMTIDGEIWVLSKGGIITRLSGGVPRNFSLSSARSGVLNPISIFTTDESDFLYILDPETSKVLVVDKDGQFKAEYSSEKISNSTDLIVSEEDSLIVFIAEGKLYSLEIKHMRTPSE